MEKFYINLLRLFIRNTKREKNTLIYEKTHLKEKAMMAK